LVWPAIMMSFHEFLGDFWRGNSRFKIELRLK
jgi:hypothetical protein